MEDQDQRLIYEFGEFRLEPAHRRLSRTDGRAIAVRDKVLDTLICLVGNAGRPIGKDELMRAVWPDTVVDENNLNQAISSLRVVLEDERRAPRFIATLVGRGYQFIGEVRTVNGGSVTAGMQPSASTPVASLSTEGSIRRRFPVSGWALTGLAAAAMTLIVGVALTVRGIIQGQRPTARNGRLVTDFPGNHRHPTFRADGSMMAFESDASGEWQIWLRSLSGGAAVQVTRDEGSAHHPSWSSLNDRIVFQRVRPGEPPSIWSVDPLGATAMRLIVEHGVSPGVSRDGRTIVYADPGGDGLWLVSDDGTNRRRVRGVQRFEEPPRAEPALSPDGRYIAYFADSFGPLGDIWVVSSAGGEPRRLTFDDGRVGSPAWTPDGRFVIYRSSRGGAPNLWAVPFAGGEARAVTLGAGEHGTPAVSRDGRFLLYSDRRTRWSLIRSDPKTGHHRSLLESRHSIYMPQVSPDGELIAYFAELPSGHHVFTVDRHGRHVRQMTHGNGDINIRPTWSADGESLLIYHEKPSGSLRRHSLDGGPSTEVFADFRHEARPSAREGPRGHAIVFLRRADRQDGGRPTRTVVRDLASGSETVLPFPALGWPSWSPSWSRDGESVLGVQSSGELVICPVTGDACEVLSSAAGPVRGVHPGWSSDESRIFFLRLPDADPSASELWVVDRDGRNQRKLVDLAPRDFVDRRFDVTPDDQIIWNRVDRGSEEIWMAALR